MHSEYPIYTKSERIADGLMHTVGVIGALAGATGLIFWASGMFCRVSLLSYDPVGKYQTNTASV